MKITGPKGALYKEDERNKRYAFLARVEQPVQLETKKWPRHIPIMNQNIDVTFNDRTWHGLGSCAVNAMISSICTGPFATPPHRPTEQRTVVPIYHELTAKSPGGQWPPHDSGVYVMDAQQYALDRGWISEYRWAYSLDEMLQALMHGPCQVALDWLSSFDVIADGNELRLHKNKLDTTGWHSICADAVNVRKQRIWFANSWGKGYCKDGWAFMTFDTVRWMFDQGKFQVAIPVPPVSEA
jgi:hypothetical protein